MMQPGGMQQPGMQPPSTTAGPTTQVHLKYLQDMTEKLMKAKQLRARFQLDRDKIHKFWEITKKELENAQYELFNADQELEQMEGRHQVDLKVYRQKVRHFCYEHKLHLEEVRRISDDEIQKATAAHQAFMKTLRSEKQETHREIVTEMETGETNVESEQDAHMKKKKVKETVYRESLANAKKNYENILIELKNELELRRRAEIHEIEERKNEHIKELMTKHEKSFGDMKVYYNTITSNNLTLIRSLKEEIQSMKKNDEENNTLMDKISNDNNELKRPLGLIQKEVATLQLQLHNYEKDKMSLHNTRQRLKALDIEYQQLKDDHAKLRTRFHEVQADRDNLVKKFEAVLNDAHEVSSVQANELQLVLNDASQQIEARDAQIQSVLAAVNLEPATLEIVTRTLEDTLEAKNRAIKDLHFELKKVEAQHKDVVAEYQRKCRVAGIPPLDVSEAL